MKVKLVQKANPQDRQAPAKWYANSVNAGTKTVKQVAEDISGRSSLTRGDIESVLINFFDTMPKYLMDGFSVQLNDVGSIRLTLSSDGADTLETFNMRSCKARVVFTPSVDFKAVLLRTKFEQD